MIPGDDSFTQYFYTRIGTYNPSLEHPKSQITERDGFPIDQLAGTEILGYD